MNTAELVCDRRCGYEVAVGNRILSARERLTPATCPRCPGGVEVVT